MLMAKCGGRPPATPPTQSSTCRNPPMQRSLLPYCLLSFPCCLLEQRLNIVNIDPACRNAAFSIKRDSRAILALIRAVRAYAPENA